MHFICAFSINGTFLVVLIGLYSHYTMRFHVKLYISSQPEIDVMTFHYHIHISKYFE